MRLRLAEADVYRPTDPVHLTYVHPSGTMNKNLKTLIKEIEAQGFTVVQGGKHLKVKNATGGTIATLPTTPSGDRWERNIRATLKRIGVLP